MRLLSSSAKDLFSRRNCIRIWFFLRFVFVPSVKRQRVIYFLHIGKNAGTQITNILQEANTDIKFIKCPHDIELADIPDDAPYFFSVRNPITRYRSGFYSRKRKGLPRIFNGWTDSERIAFENFEESNDLAEALFENNDKGQKAMCAMLAISHINQDQLSWFSGKMPFGHRPPLDIVRQEFFEKDLGRLLSKLNVSSHEVKSLLDYSTKAHENEYKRGSTLSKLAKTNLKQWYSKDFLFYRACENWIKQNTDENLS